VLLLAAAGCGVHRETIASVADAGFEALDDGASPPFRVLLFSRTAGFRHDSIPAAVSALMDLQAAGGYVAEATEDPAQFTADNLARFQVVVFLLTTGDVLDDTQQAAFEAWVATGGGYMGVHSAADTEYDWPLYGQLVGAYFLSHPAIQQASVLVETAAHPATAGIASPWVRTDEWYNFRTNPRDSVHVLMSMDETTYDPRGYSQPGGSPPMGDHPIAWCHNYDGGRAFYTALGHKGVYWNEPLFLDHVLGGIEMAAGRAKFNC
jgi:type 1 glutamine amidotransferase